MDSNKNQILFRKNRVDKNLKGKTLKGGLFTTGSQATIFALRMATTAVLARLLTPEDYGLVAMTTVTIGFLGIFKAAGLTTATIQREEINHQQISTLFWINLILGFTICGLLISLSGVIANFYGKPELKEITIALSTTFVFSGLSVQHQALLNRMMRFKAIASIQITAMIIGVSTAVYMAKTGMGYLSLVGMTISNSLAHMIGIWLTIRWMPSLPRKTEGVGSMLNFGADILGIQIINYFARQFDNILIGWKFGASTLGLYDKAYSLLLMPVSQINTPLASVIIPALSKAKSDPKEYKKILEGALQVMFFITMPLLVFLAVFSDQIVLLWLGEKWLACSELFRFLLPASIAGAILNPSGWTLLSQGNTRLLRRIGLINAVIIVTSFLIGLPYGAKGVAISYSCAMCMIALPTWHVSLKGTGITLRSILNAFYQPLVASLPGAITAWYLVSKSQINDATYWTNFQIGSVAFGTMYIAMALIAFGKWRDLKVLMREFWSK